MSPVLLTTDKCPGAIDVARGVTTDTGGPMYEDSTNELGGKAEQYDALIKVGDAVETPDGEIWVVAAVMPKDLDLVSAYRDATGLVYADVYEATHTTIPATLARKVADARSVHLP